MPDPYLPALEAFALSAEEQAAVDAAMETADPWDWAPADNATKAAIASAKARILTYHFDRHGGNCCYCRTNLHGAGPFMTDREHILPKGQALFKPLSYTIWNLAAACKRCNMQFKGRGHAFVVDAADPATFQSSDNYRFVHPNFDFWDDHLGRYTAQAGTKNLVIYARVAGSAKGDYTYEFFALHRLQVDSFDEGQGLAVEGKDSALAAAVRQLAEEHGQGPGATD